MRIGQAARSEQARALREVEVYPHHLGLISIAENFGQQRIVGCDVGLFYPSAKSLGALLGHFRLIGGPFHRNRHARPAKLRVRDFLGIQPFDELTPQGEIAHRRLAPQATWTGYTVSEMRPWRAASRALASGET